MPINASNLVPAKARPELGDLEEDLEMPESIKDRIRAAQLDDATCKRVIKKINKGERKDHKVTLAYAIIENGSLFLNAKLWVPESIRTKVIKAVHSGLETGHPRLAKTLFYLKKSYY